MTFRAHAGRDRASRFSSAGPPSKPAAAQLEPAERERAREPATAQCILVDFGLDRQEEDLAVADAPGAAGRADDVDQLVALARVDQAGDQHLGQEIDGVLGPLVGLEVALLATVAAALDGGEIVDEAR